MKQREGTVNKGDHHRLHPRLQQAPERREGCRPVQQRHAKIKAMAEVRYHHCEPSSLAFSHSDDQCLLSVSAGHWN